jgi:hypothetical protein
MFLKKIVVIIIILIWKPRLCQEKSWLCLWKKSLLLLEFATRKLNTSWFYYLFQNCYNPNLGLTTKTRVYKRLGQERDPRMWESVRMNSHNPKWTPMLGVGVSVDFWNFRKQL